MLRVAATLLLSLAGSVLAQDAPATDAREPETAAAETTADPAPAPTSAQREARIAAALQAQPGLADEAVALQADAVEFLALYRPEQTGRPQGAVLLLHDLDGNPAWPAVIAPLREGLPAHGWHTLSLQLPLSADGASPVTLEDLLAPSVERARAALQYLQGQGLHNLVVAGYGFGALVAAHAAQGPPVRGLVVIGMPSHPQREGLDAAALLERTPLPTLDIVGARDLAAVTAGSDRRAAAARRARVDPDSKPPHPAHHPRNDPDNPPGYRQVRLAGADHRYAGYERSLVLRVAGWLERHTPGMKRKKP